MKRISIALVALMMAAPAGACETAGGPYYRGLKAEYDEVLQQFDTAKAGVLKSIDNGSMEAAQIYEQRLTALEARATQLRMMWIDAQKGCGSQQ